MDSRIRILLIEDDEDDYVIFKQYLRNITNREFDLDWAARADAALEKIKQKAYDICFTDYQLNGSDGIETMLKLKQAGFEAPTVILTGKGTHEIDLRAMENGAADFVEKSSLNSDLLERCVRYVLGRNSTINKLKESRRRLQILSAKLAEAQELERKLVAQELHDSIGANLTAIKFALESKLDQMDSSKLPKGISLEQVITMVQDAIEETQRISTNLRPSILDDMGIIKTIGWLCRKFQETYAPIQVERQIEVREDDVPEPLKIVLCRLLQESLNNIMKHSRADTVWITLKKERDTLALSVADNGQGFDVKAVTSSEDPFAGMGLDSMKDRTELSNGAFELSSEKDKGTTIRVWWKVGSD
jgi:signal transduction histidine kinase